MTDEIREAEKLLMKIENKKKYEKNILILGITTLVVLLFIIVLSSLYQSIQEKEDFESIKGVGRDANIEEKKMLFTYLIEINEDKIIDKEKYKIILQNTVTVRKNGKIYIATSLTPYSAIKLAEIYKTTGIVTSDGVRVLAPLLRLKEEDKN
jgi:hypothetical protein